MEPTALTCPYKEEVGIQYERFKIGNYGYIINIDNHTNKEVSKITPILTDADAGGGEDGVYCWIVSGSVGGSVGGSDKHFFCIRVISPQEIQTKHINMMRELCVEPESINPLLGSIDKYYYAGEFLKKPIESCSSGGGESCSEININFLSGTFMVDKINAKSPSKDVIKDVTEIFENVFPGSQINIDTTGDTFITNSSPYIQMTETKIYDYIAAGATVYKLDLTNPPEEKIFKFLNGGINIAYIKLNQRLAQLKRTFDLQIKNNSEGDAGVARYKTTYEKQVISMFDEYGLGTPIFDTTTGLLKTTNKNDLDKYIMKLENTESIEASTNPGLFPAGFPGGKKRKSRKSNKSKKNKKSKKGGKSKKSRKSKKGRKGK